MNGKIALGILAALAFPAAMAASLGGDVNSVQADQAKMQGSLRTTSARSFEVHEIQAATGTAVREYVSPAGKVFAVAWKGPFHPDLRQVLGDYFEQYSQAAQAQRASRRGRGPLLIQTPALVVQLGGHMRAFSGRAYVPAMMPAGVRVEDIQ